jgi:hypothetical protein
MGATWKNPRMTMDQAEEMALTIATLPEILRESENFYIEAASLQQAAA